MIVVSLNNDTNLLCLVYPMPLSREAQARAREMHRIGLHSNGLEARARPGGNNISLRETSNPLPNVVDTQKALRVPNVLT
jgi:hypothetical protein